MEVTVNVYDLSDRNGYLFPVGLGIYHSGVAIGDEVEWTFGGSDSHASGIYWHEPLRPIQQVVVPLRTRIVLGRTHASRADVEALMREMGGVFTGRSYHILKRNCNHFADELARRLLGTGIPGFINRLAYLGATFECLLPMDRILGTVTVPEPSDDLEASWDTTAHRISEYSNPVTASEDDRRSLLAAAAAKRL